MKAIKVLQNKYKWLVCTVLAVVICLGLCTESTFAGETARVSAGSANVSVGDEFTITVSISTSGEQTAGQIELAYNSAVIEYVSGGKGGGGHVILYSAGESALSVRFKAKAPGSSAISIASAIIGVGDDDNAQVSTSNGSVTVNAPANYSSDNNLKSLSISPGVLSPAFSPSVTEYTTSVGADCDSLVVSAVANDGKASVSVSGKRMDPGKNTTTITVTAENGAKKVYKIYTTKENKVAETESATNATEAESESQSESQSESESQSVEQTVNEAELMQQSSNITVNGQPFTIAENLDAHPLPQGYELTTYDYNGLKVQAGKGTNTKLLLFYLESPEDESASGFYIYDSVTKQFTPYIEVGQPTITYAILPITDEMEQPEGYEKARSTIGGKEVDVLMDPSGTFCLFYGVDSNGVTGWFRYDFKDGTVQIYEGGDSQKATPKETPDNTNDDSKWKIAAIAACIVAFILLITVIVLIARINSFKKKVFDDSLDEEDDDLEIEGDALEDEDLDDYEENNKEDIYDADKDYAEDDEIELLDIEDINESQNKK